MKRTARSIALAVAEGATVLRFYESRLPNRLIIGQTLDQVCHRVFADRCEAERRAIKTKYATEQAVAEAPRRIEAICLALIEHYTKFIVPKRFKAQAVTISRCTAVTYRQTLERLHGLQSPVAMSGGIDDDAQLAAHVVTAEERKAITGRLLKKDDPVKTLIICDIPVGR
ncbi:hypothetical protein [Haliangium sp. UPWRP_2]|uniref:hypothetical protein n=1 Tax=Haliangium sp. UPWRP_2 TaxID=1931276 RepID=UPI000B545CD2|nr:hypothetical protein [Haliangium sp. UPWRP_2]PSM31338.1 hypothetical protein BVG81_005900 [Haliangium sp. UPWRP_2]